MSVLIEKIVRSYLEEQSRCAPARSASPPTLRHTVATSRLSAPPASRPPPGWEVYAVGSGCLAIHAASDEQPSGRTSLGWEVEDFEAWATQAKSAGVPLEVGPTGHGIAATVTAPDGTTFTVDPAADAQQAAPTDHALAVLPLWVTPETTSARELLTGLGARQRIAADGGVKTGTIW